MAKLYVNEKNKQGHINPEIYGPKKEILLITKIKTITNTVTNRSKKDSA